MIIRREDLQQNCSILIQALDANSLSVITETLELKTEGTILNMNVTNREYFAQVRLDLGTVENFHATVNANLFLKLVSQITTDVIELRVNDTNLMLKGNGTYKLPLIYEGDKLLELPEIIINNVTTEFPVDSGVLLSMLQYNSKELLKGTISKPVQKLYYVDEQGCITFTSGACVNSFMLNTPIKILLNDRIVKLFKLFKGEQVKFTLGYDSISEEIVQTKVRFESNDITLTAILSCDDTLLRSVPVTAIRGRANAEYPYSVTLNRDAVLQTINRLLLFTNKEVINLYGTFEFKKDSVTIYDIAKNNKEDIYYTNTSNIDNDYTLVVDFNDLKMTLDTCNEQYINIHFGNSTALVISRGNVKNVIPEIRTFD